jgi:hypothetical protein
LRSSLLHKITSFDYNVSMSTISAKTVENAHPSYNSNPDRLELHYHNHNSYTCFIGNRLQASDISAEFLGQLGDKSGVVAFFNTVDYYGYNSSFGIPVTEQTLDALSAINLDNPFITLYEVPLKPDGTALQQTTLGYEDLVYLNDEPGEKSAEAIEKGIIKETDLGEGDFLAASKTYIQDIMNKPESVNLEDIMRAREYNIVGFAETSDTEWGGTQSVYNPEKSLEPLAQLIDYVPGIQYDPDKLNAEIEKHSMSNSVGIS